MAEKKIDKASQIGYARKETRKGATKEMKKKRVTIETICKLTKEKIEKIEH